MVVASEGTQKPTILVVDDDRQAAQLIQMTLERQGSNVIVVHSGTQAIELIEETLSQRSAWPPVPIDLVFLDAMMPEVDGFQVCQRIKSDPRLVHIPLIMLTALTGLADKLAAVQLGADGYITKPFLPEELAATVQARVQVKRREEELLRRNRELEAICAVSAAVSTLDPERVVRQGLAALMEHTGLAAAAIYIHDQATQMLVRAGQVAIDRPETQPLEGGLPGQVFCSQRPVLTTDLEGDLGSTLQGLGNAGIAAFLGVPLLGEREARGVLEVYQWQESGFVDRDADLYLDIGKRFAGALQNAEAFQQAQGQSAALVS